ncbi:tetratricopeptide repeat protein, partial [Streptomyces sp. NPDC087437]|uniref:tetratricopeptide repeat protein n=1 Tax=Streptomyces sp. NPDC087437 TaxID=3365789 RepID=UPI00381FACCF
PNFAASLGNLSIRLAEVGRRAEALTTTEQAVEVYRRLAADNPDAHEPHLAACLSDLGILLGEVGRQTEALTTTEQAVEIRRRLAADNPDAHEPHLAASVERFAMLLVKEGDFSGALRATGEAVEIYRSHVATVHSLLPKLHGVLDLQAMLLQALGHQREAEEIRGWLTKNPLPPDSHK